MIDSARRQRQRLDDLRAHLARLGYGKDAGSRRIAAAAAPPSPPRPPPPPAAAPTAAARTPILYRRDLPRPAASRRARQDADAVSVPLEAAVDGTEVAAAEFGPAFLVVRCVGENRAAAKVNREFRRCLAEPDSGMIQALAGVCTASELRPEDVVFVDLETTGLSSSPLFLIGAMVWEDGGFAVRQYLARNYAEEAAVIALFAALCTGKRLLVTFNGKSFDIPYVRARAAVHRVAIDLALPHLDLLHVSRRVWRGQFPNCRLQTLERCVCGRSRTDDIPGGDIPDAYHSFVRSGNATCMAAILRHNMLDLITLAELMVCFPPSA